MANNDITNNVFARLLLFYEKYKRSKLNSNDLQRIVKKYGKNSYNLISDFEKKYQIQLPSSISYLELLQLINTYDIPDSYRNLLPIINYEYDKEIDILSSSFNPLKVLNNKKIIAPNINIEPFDNMFKFRLIDNDIQIIKSTAKTVLSSDMKVSSSSSSSDMKVSLPTDEVETFYRKPLLLQVSLLASANYKDINQRGQQIWNESPLGFLQDCMERRIQIKVTIRQRKAIRGTLVGFLIAYDKHFNLVMRDVDEEYIPTSHLKASRIQRKKMRFEQRGMVYQIKKMKRHLPQLLVRGDIIVLISRK